ncbi:MAG: tRNA pseudouridine(55) synthase TruB [Bacillota bacterium]|nr:tRNA pseudouridine(55) synthase TruB [Bacillota bacterium]
MNEISGVINLYKPKGISSQNAVSRVKYLLKVKKCGHAGTLDPAARGVLPIMVGSATKCSELLMSEVKEYAAEFELGRTTDSFDNEGLTVTDIPKSSINLTKEEVVAAINSFLGDSMQLPPMFSAIQVNGKRLYKLARSGIEIERSKRPISIFKIELENYDEASCTGRFFVCCSKGTYIRSLVSDIGEKLGCGAVMTGLERVKTGIFSALSSVTLENLEKEPLSYLIPVEDCFPLFPKIIVEMFYITLMKNGQRILQQKLGINQKEDEYSLVYGDDGAFYGIGRGIILQGELYLELYKKL